MRSGLRLDCDDDISPRIECIHLGWTCRCGMTHHESLDPFKLRVANLCPCGRANIVRLDVLLSARVSLKPVRP
jgi:hypothetical protein